MISEIIGTGSYLPEKPLTNNKIAKIISGTDNEWIITRTGIKQRYFAKKNELSSDLATKAALDAIESSKINIDTIDGIIVSTVTPDLTFPPVAAIVQGNLKIKKGFAFDIEATCTGFLVGLSVANSLISTGMASRILVIGVETFSKILDFNDRNSVLFGDGAGCVILDKKNSTNNSGILTCKLKSEGEYVKILKSSGGVGSTQTAGNIQMNGQEVFRHAVIKLSEILNEIIKDINITKEEIDFVIPHQANIRIIDAVREKLKLPKEKVIITVDKHANTSAASIPLALDYAFKSKIIKKGNLLILEAIGSGLSWGAVALRF